MAGWTEAKKRSCQVKSCLPGSEFPLRLLYLSPSDLIPERSAEVHCKYHGGLRRPTSGGTLFLSLELFYRFKPCTNGAIITQNASSLFQNWFQLFKSLVKLMTQSGTLPRQMSGSVEQLTNSCLFISFDNFEF